MTPERWREVSRIYHDALACDRSRRDAFVREACAGDEGVRQEVESLLAQPGVWDVASAWTALAAGPPRLAGPAYTWARPASLDEALLPPGLHASFQ